MDSEFLKIIGSQAADLAADGYSGMFLIGRNGSSVLVPFGDGNDLHDMIVSAMLQSEEMQLIILSAAKNFFEQDEIMEQNVNNLWKKSE